MPNEIDFMPEPEQILMNEDEMIAGLLEAANYKSDESCRKTIQIKRPTSKKDSSGNPVKKVLFTFTVRPLGEDEISACQRQSTRKLPHPNGPKWPKIDGDINMTEYRARRIYTATCEEDRKKLWDNQKVKDSLDVIQGWEVIDKVLRYAEKDAVLEVIDSISGDDMDGVEYAKN